MSIRKKMANLFAKVILRKKRKKAEASLLGELKQLSSMLDEIAEPDHESLFPDMLPTLFDQCEPDNGNLKLVTTACNPEDLSNHTTLRVDNEEFKFTSNTVILKPFTQEETLPCTLIVDASDHKIMALASSADFEMLSNFNTLVEKQLALRRITKLDPSFRQLLREKATCPKVNTLPANPPPMMDEESLKLLYTIGSYPPIIQRHAASIIQKLNTGVSSTERTHLLTRLSYILTLNGPSPLPQRKQKSYSDVIGILDHHIWGVPALKELIAETVLLSQYTGEGNYLPLLIHGPPGVAKTTFAYALGEVLDRPVEVVNLAGADTTLLLGASSIYNSSQAGVLAKALYRHPNSNGAIIIVLEEIDKMNTSEEKGRDPYASLAHLLAEKTIYDSYIEAPISAKNCFIIATANNISSSSIPEYISNRFVCLPINGYSVQDKAKIARHILPKILQDLGVTASTVTFTDSAFHSIASKTYDQGMRETIAYITSVIRTAVAGICRNIYTAPVLIDEAFVTQHIQKIEQKTDNRVIIKGFGG